MANSIFASPFFILPIPSPLGLPRLCLTRYRLPRQETETPFVALVRGPAGALEGRCHALLGREGGWSLEPPLWTWNDMGVQRLFLHDLNDPNLNINPWLQWSRWSKWLKSKSRYQPTRVIHPKSSQNLDTVETCWNPWFFGDPADPLWKSPHLRGADRGRTVRPLRQRRRRGRPRPAAPGAGPRRRCGAGGRGRTGRRQRRLAPGVKTRGLPCTTATVIPWLYLHKFWESKKNIVNWNVWRLKSTIWHNQLGRVEL